VATAAAGFAVSLAMVRSSRNPDRNDVLAGTATDGTALRAARLPYPPPFQDLRTLSEHICTGESTIENWVKLGLFPEPKRIGGKRLWSWREVERHLSKIGETPAASPDELAERIKHGTRQAVARGQDH
jgi:predicted DNA-binding transcriptional regulator AlpA